MILVLSLIPTLTLHYFLIITPPPRCPHFHTSPLHLNPYLFIRVSISPLSFYLNNHQPMPLLVIFYQYRLNWVVVSSSRDFI